MPYSLFKPFSLPAESLSPAHAPPRTRAHHCYLPVVPNTRVAATTTVSSFQIQHCVGQHPGVLPPWPGRIRCRQEQQLCSLRVSRGTIQRARQLSVGGSRPQASKPAKNRIRLYLTLVRAGRAFHQMSTANHEQSFQGGQGCGGLPANSKDYFVLGWK